MLPVALWRALYSGEIKSSTAECEHTWRVHKDTHPLHPRVLENLSSTETKSGIPDQQLGYEIFGALCDVSPVLLWKLILALLDAVKQVTLWTRIPHNNIQISNK